MLDMNATQAAIRSGFSVRNARPIAKELLERLAVIKGIEAAKTKRSEATKVAAAFVLKRLWEECEADLADLYDESTGALKPVSDWPPVWRRGLIQGVETFEERDKDGNVIGLTRKVRLSDRVRRLELLGKHFRVNAFADVIEHRGLDKLAERLSRAKDRRLHRAG
jgi:phage terminase small subunit